MEAVEATGIGDQGCPLGLEGLPHGPVGLLGMRVSLGVGDHPVEQQGVQLVVAPHPDARREQSLAHQPDLVLDLALLPARGRRAGHRLDEVVRAHLQEAAIVGALTSDEDRVHGGLHVVVDPALAGAAEEGERPVVGVEHHLLALARVGPHERHARVAEPDVGDLDLRGRTADQHRLVAPVELVGLARREGERHEGLGCDRGTLALPALGVAAHRVVAALVAEPTQGLVDTHQGQSLTPRLAGVRQEHPIEFVPPRSELRGGLDGAGVLERRRLGADDLAHDLARDPQFPADLFDRLLLHEICAADLCDRLHDQHPVQASRSSRKAVWMTCPGGPVWTPITPKTGSLFHA